jgi:hypothetical protein
MVRGRRPSWHGVAEPPSGGRHGATPSVEAWGKGIATPERRSVVTARGCGAPGRHSTESRNRRPNGGTAVRRDQLHVGIPSAFSPARTKRTRRCDDEAEHGRRPLRRIPLPRPSTTPLREQQVEAKTTRGGRGKGDGRETQKWEEMRLPLSRGHHMV